MALTPNQIYSTAISQGFAPNQAVTLTAIILAESGGNPGAHNQNVATGDNSYGLAQINMLGGMGPNRRQQYGLASNDQLLDPATNLRVAFGESGKGTNFAPWSTFKSGAYKQYLGVAQQAARGGSGAVVGGGGVAGQAAAGTGAPDLSTPQTLGEKLNAASDVIGGEAPSVIGGQAPTVFQSGTSPDTPAGTQTQNADGTAPTTPVDAGMANQSTGPTAQAIKLAVDTANKHTPYVWGGNDLNTGVDCSGFIQQVYKSVGINLPRVSNAQINAGQKVDPGQMAPGDILGWAYDNSLQGGATHVALYIGGGMMAEALHRGEPVHIVPVRKPQFVSRPVPGKAAVPDTASTGAGATPQQPQMNPDGSVWGRLAAMSNAMGAMSNYDVGGTS